MKTRTKWLFVVCFLTVLFLGILGTQGVCIMTDSNYDICEAIPKTYANVFERELVVRSGIIERQSLSPEEVFEQMRESFIVTVVSSYDLFIGDIAKNETVVVTDYKSAMENLPAEATGFNMMCWTYLGPIYTFLSNDAEIFRDLSGIICEDVDNFQFYYIYPPAYIPENQA